MNRRFFFTSLLGGAIAAHQLDIEKLLWVPGEKTIFIPPAKPAVVWIQDRWIRLSDGIHVETLNGDTGEVLEAFRWPGERMPFLLMPSGREPDAITFGPYPADDWREDSGRLTAVTLRAQRQAVR